MNVFSLNNFTFDNCWSNPYRCTCYIQHHMRYSYVRFISWPIPWNWQREQNYDKRHFNSPIVNFPLICSNICTTGIDIYVSVDTVFQRLWCLSWFPLLRVAANEESTEPDSQWLCWIHYWQGFTVIMTWLFNMKYAGGDHIYYVPPIISYFSRAGTAFPSWAPVFTLSRFHWGSRSTRYL
jgi:hypothetical protein